MFIWYGCASGCLPSRKARQGPILPRAPSRLHACPKIVLLLFGGEGEKEDRELRAAEASPMEKASSLAPVPAEGVGQDGHGPVAGADVGGDVDGEPVGFERGASVDQGCGESSCE